MYNLQIANLQKKKHSSCYFNSHIPIQRVSNVYTISSFLSPKNKPWKFTTKEL